MVISTSSKGPVDGRSKELGVLWQVRKDMLDCAPLMLTDPM